MNRIDFLSKIVDLYPPPQVFNIEDSSNPDIIRKACNQLQNEGLVELISYANCGLERVKGEFVKVTDSGIRLLND